MTLLPFSIEKQNVKALIGYLENSYKYDSKGKRYLNENKSELITELTEAEQSYLEAIQNKKLHLIQGRKNLFSNDKIDLKMLEIYRNKIDKNLFLPHSINGFAFCCYCGTSAKVTDEHVLPKENFYQYAITPCNLVPCCSDCNTNKGTTVINSPSRTPFHPYFEDYDFRDWVTCEIISTSANKNDIFQERRLEAKITMNAERKESENPIEFDRYNENYKIFELGVYFTSEANTTLVAFVKTISENYQSQLTYENTSVKKYILRQLEGKVEFFINENSGYSYLNTNFLKLILYKELHFLISQENTDGSVYMKLIEWINSFIRIKLDSSIAI